MAQASKNSRTTSATQRFMCSCGGEIKMKTLFESGNLSVSWQEPHSEDAGYC